MTKTPDTTPQPNYPNQIIGNNQQPGAEHAANAAPISADLRRISGTHPAAVAQQDPLLLAMHLRQRAKLVTAGSVDALSENAANVLAAQQERIEELVRYQVAFTEWHDKTEWVQKTVKPKELGKHRADVLRERIEALTAQPARDCLQQSAEAKAWEVTNAEFGYWTACKTQDAADEIAAQHRECGYGDSVVAPLFPALQAAQPAPAAAAVPEGLEHIRVGRLPTMNQDEYPGLGNWWVQLRVGSDGDEVLARVYGSSPEQAHARAAALAAAPAQAETYPVLDGQWRRRMLDGAVLVRDEMGCGDHPALPALEEDMNPLQFFGALGIELTGRMAESEMDADAYDAMIEACDSRVWTPATPDGEGWVLVSIFENEDGPVAWWIREAVPVKPERKNRKGVAPAQAQEDARDAELFRSLHWATTLMEQPAGEAYQDAMVAEAEKVADELDGKMENTTMDQYRRILEAGLEAARAAQGGA